MDTRSLSFSARDLLEDEKFSLLKEIMVESRSSTSLLLEEDFVEIGNFIFDYYKSCRHPSFNRFIDVFIDISPLKVSVEDYPKIKFLISFLKRELELEDLNNHSEWFFKLKGKEHHCEKYFKSYDAVELRKFYLSGNVLSELEKFCDSTGDITEKDLAFFFFSYLFTEESEKRLLEIFAKNGVHYRRFIGFNKNHKKHSLGVLISNCDIYLDIKYNSNKEEIYLDFIKNYCFDKEGSFDPDVLVKLRPSRIPEGFERFHFCMSNSMWNRKIEKEIAAKLSFLLTCSDPYVRTWIKSSMQD